MNTEELIREISAKDVDVAGFTARAIADASLRSEIVRLLTTHPHIMVYYHAFYIVDQASRSRPDLFYPSWDDIAALLQHPNSYHRDIALTVLANLTAADGEERFAALSADYFACLNDPKFMTGECCLRGCGIILRHKPAYRERILDLLLELDSICAYTPKQIALLKSGVLDVIDSLYAETEARARLDAFIRACTASISPKTKRRAKELAARYAVRLQETGAHPD